MRTQTKDQWFRPVIVLGKKLKLLFSCKFEKEASKKEKVSKVLKPQKFKKHWFRDYQSKTFHFYLYILKLLKPNIN
jgi:hypothetical protein